MFSFPFGSHGNERHTDHPPKPSSSSTRWCARPRSWTCQPSQVPRALPVRLLRRWVQGWLSQHRVQVSQNTLHLVREQSVLSELEFDFRQTSTKMKAPSWPEAQTGLAQSQNCCHLPCFFLVSPASQRKRFPGDSLQNCQRKAWTKR